jgi:hypothetical protein
MKTYLLKEVVFVTNTDWNPKNLCRIQILV